MSHMLALHSIMGQASCNVQLISLVGKIFIFRKRRTAKASILAGAKQPLRLLLSFCCGSGQARREKEPLHNFCPGREPC